MTVMKIVKTLILKAPPHHVWSFLTQADRLALWFMKGEADIQADGPYTLVTNSYGREGERVITGDVLAFDPPKRLVHTFTHPYLDGIITQCEWTLEPLAQGTLLTLTHTGWEDLGQDKVLGLLSDHDKGWDEHFIRLRSVTA
ncbi:SRPBCC family protein [Woodsholea maritima]|uniref:SRPBCC family protein n=1 Tax=Woodsholea maritima TaxID=240237 RepID=UPI00036DE5CF|nr:SRPBCC domain-containing protein [Woodsholea maritima]